MNIRPKQKKADVRPVHLHSLGDPEWRNLAQVARLHGTSPANVGHAFNSGMSKIAEEVLLQMTGKKPRPEALLQLVKSEEFGLAVAEIMREGTLIVEGAPLPQGRTSPSIQEGGGGAPEARPQREKNDP